MGCTDEQLALLEPVLAGLTNPTDAANVLCDAMASVSSAGATATGDLASGECLQHFSLASFALQSPEWLDMRHTQATVVLCSSLNSSTGKAMTALGFSPHNINMARWTLD